MSDEAEVYDGTTAATMGLEPFTGEELQAAETAVFPPWIDALLKGLRHRVYSRFQEKCVITGDDTPEQLQGRLSSRGRLYLSKDGSAKSDSFKAMRSKSFLFDPSVTEPDAERIGKILARASLGALLVKMGESEFRDYSVLMP